MARAGSSCGRSRLAAANANPDAYAPPTAEQFAQWIVNGSGNSPPCPVAANRGLPGPGEPDPRCALRPRPGGIGRDRPSGIRAGVDQNPGPAVPPVARWADSRSASLRWSLSRSEPVVPMTKL